MTNYLMKQFEITRNGLLQDVDKLNDSVISVQPDGIRNNIHWQIGHILTTAEQFLFGFPEKTQHIPESYHALFANGTKPADWNGDVPSVATLVEQLKDQLERIKQIPAEQFEQPLDKPFLGQGTVGELAVFNVFHEANHIGQIHAMNLAALEKNK